MGVRGGGRWWRKVHWCMPRRDLLEGEMVTAAVE
jgi:hypothetical protein